MAFICGPRQCGKTTLAKMLLQQRRQGSYHNWDDITFRRKWVQDPKQVIPEPTGRGVPLVVLDEIHKDRRWKRNLKGVYDTLAFPCDIIVTRSARLGIYRKGSDSLLGRYHHFLLHPFSLREMHTSIPGLPGDSNQLIDSLFNRTRPRKGQRQRDLELLMRFGPFPEPVPARKTPAMPSLRDTVVAVVDFLAGVQGWAVVGLAVHSA